MNANYQKLPFDLRPDLYMDFWVRSDFFGFHWHYHPEIEICYVQQGYGQRLIGESVERFEAGDFVLVGSNLPHCWITDDVFNQSPEQMEIYVIHIDNQKIQHLFGLHEFKGIEQLLEQAKSGLAFDIEIDKSLLLSLQSYEKADGLSKILSLLQLLDNMTQSSSKKQLCTTAYIPEIGKHVEERILKVCQYIHESYKDKIALDELARISNMNTTAFCRFFKKVIGKTAIEYVNELRINSACSELRVSNKPINQIAYDNGFLSLSHFNKLFRQYNGRTPSSYREVFR